jgi:hypothetical protein
MCGKLHYLCHVRASICGEPFLRCNLFAVMLAPPSGALDCSEAAAQDFAACHDPC